MNTIIYSAFADELEQIKLAQLEKDAFGQLLAQGAKSMAKGLSTGVRKIMGGGAKPMAAAKPMGALKSPGTVAASPMAKAAPSKAMAPTMAMGSAPTMAATPATVPYSAAKMSRPPGVGTEWGRVGMRAQLPAGTAAQHEQVAQQVLARSRARMGAGRVAPAPQRGPLPIGKQQLNMAQLSPVQQTRLRLFQQQARQRMAAA